jgi:hypothetical protein
VTNIAKALQTPSRAVDSYIKSRLSPSTLASLASYMSNTNTAALQGLSDVLQYSLLIDFNNIALGAFIYDPVRFQAVTLRPGTTAEKDSYIAILTAYNADNSKPAPPALGSYTLVNYNRDLLEDAYGSWTTDNPSVFVWNYTSGNYTAATMYELIAYPNGNTTYLGQLLLRDLYFVTLGPSIWNSQRFIAVNLRSDTSKAVVSFGNSGNNVTPDISQMNRMLLEDAYPNLYVSGKLTASTIDQLTSYPAALNTYLTGFAAKQATYATALTAFKNAFATFNGAGGYSDYKAALATYNTAYGVYKAALARRSRLYGLGRCSSGLCECASR